MRLAPLTALFGTNSSVKTSLLQLLLMLKQTADSPDRNQALDLGDERSLVELGTFRDLVFKHDAEASLHCELAWTLSKSIEVSDPARKGKLLFSVDALGFSVDLKSLDEGEGGRTIVQRMSYSFAGNEFGMAASGDSSTEYDLATLQGKFRFKRTTGRAWKLPPPAKCYGFPDQVRAYFQNAAFLSDLELSFEQLCSNIYYLGPLRDYPKRQYSWGGSRPSDMGRRGERVVDALLASRQSGHKIAYGKGRKSLTLEERVASWLKELGLIASFEVRPVAKGSKLFQVWVRRSSGSAEVLITDVGFGVSQILPVLALCYYVPKGSTVVLEQPEIHLHPAVQSGLADVFLDAIKTQGIQLIVESHSEHLLRRLQRRIAEEQLKPDSTALYFCGMKDGESSLVPLQLDEFGTIQNWPANFFGDEFGEIAATQDAILARQDGSSR